MARNYSGLGQVLGMGIGYAVGKKRADDLAAQQSPGYGLGLPYHADQLMASAGGSIPLPGSPQEQELFAWAASGLGTDAWMDPKQAEWSHKARQLSGSLSQYRSNYKPRYGPDGEFSWDASIMDDSRRYATWLPLLETDNPEEAFQNYVLDDKVASGLTGSAAKESAAEEWEGAKKFWTQGPGASFRAEFGSSAPAHMEQALVRMRELEDHLGARRSYGAAGLPQDGKLASPAELRSMGYDARDEAIITPTPDDLGVQPNVSSGPPQAQGQPVVADSPTAFSNIGHSFPGRPDLAYEKVLELVQRAQSDPGSLRDVDIYFLQGQSGAGMYGHLIEPALGNVQQYRMQLQSDSVRRMITETLRGALPRTDTLGSRFDASRAGS
jgi:hypothetical protein